MGDLRDQLLHLPEQLGRRLPGLDLLATKALVVRMKGSDLGSKLVALLDGSVGGRALTLQLAALAIQLGA